MSAPIELDLDALERAALATGGERWQQEIKRPNVIQPASPSFDCICTVQTSNVENWPEIAAFIAAANPAVVLELVRRLRAAEALATARIEQIPTEAKMVTVFTDLIQEHPELRDQFEAFAEAIKKRCTSGRWTLVAFFPAESDIQALDAEQMRAAGWVRADQTT